MNSKLAHSALIPGLVFLAISIIFASQSLWLYGKAQLAQVLLNRAWQQGLAQGAQHKPWPWADMHPVARISIPSTQDTLVVLSDVSGESMAFGPGLIAGDLALASSNTVAIGGHRDTHMSFLEDLQALDELDLHTADGKTHRYRLLDKQVVDSRSQAVQITHGEAGLVLITCYPFNALQTGGPLRMLARAVHMNTDPTI